MYKCGTRLLLPWYFKWTEEQTIMEIDMSQMSTDIVQSGDNKGTIVWSEQNLFEEASKFTWADAKLLAADEINNIVTTAQTLMINHDWSSLREVDLTVTLNVGANRYCCYESGGAKSSSGHAVLIATPDGRKPLAMSAFRKHPSPNSAQAVIQVWPGCIVAIATQTRGVGVVLLYRIESIKPKQSVFVHWDESKSTTIGTNVVRFAAELKLAKVIDIATHEIRCFNNDLSNIGNNHQIIKTVMRKATIFNCQQALYIRPFFYVKDGFKMWDMSSLKSDKPCLIGSQVSIYLTEVLAKMSTAVRAMPKNVYPYIGMEVLGTTCDKRFSEDFKDGRIDDTIDPASSYIYIKFATFVGNKSEVVNMVIDETVFNEFRDFFYNKTYKTFHDIINGSEPGSFERMFISRYAGN